MTPKTPGQLRWEFFDAWEAVEPHRAAWDCLCESVGAGVFASFEWVRIWWRCYGAGRTLGIRLVWIGDRLIAAFPLFREVLWTGGIPLRLIRLIGCDHGLAPGGLMIMRGHEDEAVRALRHSLREVGLPWDVIHLGVFRGYVDLHKVLIDAFADRFADSDVYIDDEFRPYVVFQTAVPYEEFLEKTAKGRRTTILRKQRALEREHEVVHTLLTTPEEIAGSFDEFLESHDVLWRAKGMRGYFNEWPQAKAFHREVVTALAPLGKVFMTRLTVDGQVVAAQYCLRCGDLLHWLQPARIDASVWNKFGTGNISLLAMLKAAIDSGIRLVDGGSSPIDYKLELGGTLSSMKVLAIVRRDWLTAVRICAFRVGAWLLDKAYASLWHRRIAPFLGAGGFPYARAWIRSRLHMPSTGPLCPHRGAGQAARQDGTVS